LHFIWFLFDFVENYILMKYDHFGQIKEENKKQKKKERKKKTKGKKEKGKKERPAGLGLAPAIRCPTRSI